MADIAELGFKIDPGREAARAKRDLDSMSSAAKVASRSVDEIKGSFVRMAGAASAALAAAMSVKILFAFKDAIAEVSTLVDTSTFSMQNLTAGALEQAKAYGNLIGQVKAYYQIISAGVGTVDTATEVLTTANKLAVGGVTDVFTASNALVSVLNAYGLSTKRAIDVSDVLFVAMRDGTTTVGEMASALGRISPLAAKTGVSFEELAAAVAAITKGGLSTDETITGLKNVLSSIAAPTGEAMRMAKRLNIEFSAAGLAAKGFAGFLQEIADKTKGDTTILAQLFGDVRGLISILSMTGQAGKDFAVILEHMREKAGSTEDAFNKMANSPGFQLQRVISGLTVELIKLADAFAERLAPSLKFLADNMDKLPALFDLVGKSIIGLSVIFGTMYVSSVGLATAATYAFGAAYTAVGLLIKGSLFGILAIILGEIIFKIYEAVKSTEEFGAGFQKVGDAASRLWNFLKLSFSALMENFHQITSAITAMFMDAFALIYKAFSSMYNGIVAGLNALGVEATKLDAEWTDRLYKGLFDDAKKHGEEAGKLWSQAFAEFTRGPNAEELGLRGTVTWEDVPKSTPKSDIIKPAIEAKPSGINFEDLLKYEAIVKKQQQHIEASRLEAQTLGMTAEAATRLRVEQDLLNKAANDNIALSAEQKAKMSELAQVTAAVEEQTRRLTEAYELGKATSRGFFSDLRNNVKEGQSLWEAFGNAGKNALDRIANKATEMVADGVWNMIFNSFKGGAGTGTGQSILSLFGSANGNVFPAGVGGYANQVVTQPTVFPFAKGGSFGVMGEAGPEAVMPLSRDSSGRLGVKASNDNAATPVKIEISFAVDNNGNIVPLIQQISGQTAQVVVAPVAKAVRQIARQSNQQRYG